MAVDTSRASERLRAWNEGDDDAIPRGYTHDSLDFQRDLRSLLARAEAAEQSARNLSAKADDALREGEMVRRERDAALAERDRLADAIERDIAEIRHCNGYTRCCDRFSEMTWTRVALAYIKKEPTDGE